MSAVSSVSNIRLFPYHTNYITKNKAEIKSSGIYESDHLNPDLKHFPEMLEAFQELANTNPLLCAFLLPGRENDYLFRKKQAEAFVEQEKKKTRGHKKNIK